MYVFYGAPTPIPTQIVSRKLHGGIPRDISLSLTGNLGIECRSGGASNSHQLVLTFMAATTFTSAFVTAGTGTVNSTSGSGSSNLTINLTSVVNAQTIAVTLFGVNDGIRAGNVVVPIGVLLGDTNGSGSVTSSDVSQTKLRSGQPVDATNFRSDVIVTNSINGTDVSTVKSRTGTALP